MFIFRLVTALLNTHKELNMVERGNRRQLMTRYLIVEAHFIE